MTDNNNNDGAMMVDSDDDSSNKWNLVKSFVSDDQGVRAACILGSGDDSNILVTGTQMGALYFFDLETSALKTNIEPAFQHDHAVTALLALPSAEANNNSKLYFASGCKDSLIRIFCLDDGSSSLQVVTELKGHEKPVTSLALIEKRGGGNCQYLVSGSWDGTAQVYNLQTKARVAVLEGHENSVSVAPWDNGTTTDPNNTILGIATGSAGVASQGSVVQHTLRLWNVNVQTGERSIVHKIVQDHDGSIRDVTAICDDKQLLLATCSNDGTVKLRNTTNGKTQSTLTFLLEEEHPPMLLSCAYIPKASTVVAGAEDGHVVAWSLDSQSQPQIIRHPACVWQVFECSNGDGFGTCCQDGKVYLWTRSKDAAANANTKLREDFDAAVTAATTAKRQGPSEEEIAKLPLWENQSSMPGRSEGQVQVFNKNGIAIAAQYSMASQTWIEVGQVMGSSAQDDSGGGAGGSGSGMLNGTHYDHILPIQVDTTAEGGVADLQIGYNTGENPFVAAQRFIDEHVLPQYHLAEIADYITQRVGRSNITLGGGGGAASAGAGGGAVAPAAAVTGVPMFSYQHLPAKSYKTFDLKASAAASTFEKMKTKLQGFGCLSEEQLNRIDSLMKTLSSEGNPLNDTDLQVLTEMLESMPVNESFPALDLARLAILRSDAVSTSERATFWKNLIQKALSICQQSSSADGNNNKLEGPEAVAIPMLTLRLCSNGFANPSCQEAIATAYLMDILSCAKFYVRSSNKNVRLSVATVVYNICLYIHSNSSVGGGAISDVLVEIINDMLSCRLYNESEAVMRTLVALGTLIMANDNAKKVASGFFLTSKVEPAASPHSQDVKAAAKEVYSLLQ